MAGSLLAPLLFASSQTINGIWHGGGPEVYTDGNEHYCIKTDNGSLTISLDADNPLLDSCIFLTFGDVKAQQCGTDPNLTVSGLSNRIYKIVVAPGQEATSEGYSLTVDYSGTFGRCTDYYAAGFLGMTVSDVNFVLALAGLLTASAMFGAFTYIILTLGNF